MFYQAKNIVVTGGQLTNVITSAKGGFERLQEHVATSAFYKSVCQSEINEITKNAVARTFAWITQDDERTAHIAWLNGAPGTRKALGCHSIAAMCLEHHIWAASFFFARRDATRNHIYSLVATLAYQIIIRLPAVKETIVGVIESNPLIFDQALETQISELIIKPLWKLQLATIGTLPKVVIIVDAIDECVNSPVSQVNIIRTFAKYLSTCEAPIIVVFGSHSHTHLKEAFGTAPVANMLLNVPLDTPDDLVLTMGCLKQGIYSWIIPLSTISSQKAVDPGTKKKGRNTIASAEEVADMIGKLCSSSEPEVWNRVLLICDSAFASNANGSRATQALIRAFKDGDTAAQLRAARLWAIMLRNYASVILAQSWEQELIYAVEGLITSQKTSPMVRQRLLGVVAVAAYTSPDDPHPQFREGFRELWKRVKPQDQPEEGVPFNEDDHMGRVSAPRIEDGDTAIRWCSISNIPTPASPTCLPSSFGYTFI